VLASEGVTEEGLQATQEPLCPYAYEYKLQEEVLKRRKTAITAEMQHSQPPHGRQVFDSSKPETH
jgi:hypothetical protein